MRPYAYGDHRMELVWYDIRIKFNNTVRRIKQRLCNRYNYANGMPLSDMSHNFQKGQIALIGLARVQRRQIGWRRHQWSIMGIPTIGVDAFFRLSRALNGGENLLHGEAVAWLPVLPKACRVVTHKLHAQMRRRICVGIQVRGCKR